MTGLKSGKYGNTALLYSIKVTKNLMLKSLKFEAQEQSDLFVSYPGLNS